MLIALLTFSCFEGENGSVILIIGSSSYVPADGVSHLDLTLTSTAFIRGGPPNVKVDRGTLTFIERTSALAWKARLTAGHEAGRIKFTSPDADTVVLNPLYFIPYDASDLEPGVADVLAGFTIEIDATLGLVNTKSTAPDNLFGSSVTIAAFWTNPLDVAGLALGVTDLFGSRVFMPSFSADPLGLFGDTVTAFVFVQGTGLTQDLTDLHLILDPGPGTGRLQDPQHCEGVEGVCYELGDFPATSRAVKYESWPAWVHGVLEFRNEGGGVIELSGRVTARAPEPDGAKASFTIRPYLTMVGTDALTVSWETGGESESFIVHGKTPACNRVAGGVTERMRNFENFDGSRAPYFNSIFHRVTLTGLEPGRDHYYRIIAANQPTEPTRFKSPPLPGAPFTFGVIGDTQHGDEAAHGRVIGQMQKQDLDFFLHAGDHVQFSGILSNWLDFFRSEAPLLKNSPIASTLGNHDLSLLNHFYRRYFASDGPFPDSDELAGRMHSFDYGNSHFVFIDTTLPLDDSAPQHQWLEADLAAAQANPQRKFTFVVHHFPYYSIFLRGTWPDGQTWLEPLFRDHDVDAVFTGHIHLYERSSVDGRVYICSSGGGGFLRDEPKDLSLNPYYVTHAVVHHFLKVGVGPDSFDLTAIDDQGNIIDQVHYFKP